MQTYVVVTMLAVTLVLGVYVQAVGAQEGGKPFAAVWAAIEQLKERLDTLEDAGGPEGPAGASLHLYDGNGQHLGILAEYSQNLPITFHPAIDAYIRFSDDRSGPKIFPQGGTHLFDGPNCTGSALLTNGFIREKQALYQFGSTPYYVVDLSSPPTTRYAASRRGVGTEPACVNFSELQEVPEALLLKQVSLPFSLPLAWPLETRAE